MKSVSIKKHLPWYALWFTLIFMVDRITKWYALQSFGVPHDINAFLQLKLIFNRGVSWGMFHSEHPIVFGVLTVFICTIICALALFTLKKIFNKRTVYAELAVLAGASSNIIDRIAYGGVIDFIHVHIGLWSWPIFNVADVAIVLGIFWILWEHCNES